MTPGPAAALALAEAALSPDATAASMRARIDAFFAALAGVDAAAAGSAVDALAPAIGAATGEALVLIAQVAGTCVEQGADAGVGSGAAALALAVRLPDVARSARALADSAWIQAGEDARDAARSGDVQAVEAARVATAARMPDGARAWIALEGLLAPSLALLSDWVAAREVARQALSDLDALDGWHPAAGWLARFLRVLYDEPFLAIEPSTRLGIRGRLSGISENFQLNTLLMDAFPRRGLRPRPRVAPEAVDVARGDGPQRIDGTVTGAWDLFGWPALRADHSLPGVQQAGFMDHTIWNEGTPSDIPVLDGERVILLGPPSYQRAWPAVRTFARLRGSLGEVRRLSPGEVAADLERICRAVTAGRAAGTLHAPTPPAWSPDAPLPEVVDEERP